MGAIGIHPRASGRHPEVADADMATGMRGMIRYKQRAAEVNMNVSEYMEKHGLADAALDEAALPYERGDYESEADTVYGSSHVSMR